MKGLCRYRDIFGESKKGVHSYRVFDIAVVDVLLTIIAAWLLGEYEVYGYKFDGWVNILFIMSVVLHKMFCVKTKMTYIVDSIMYDIGLMKEKPIWV